MAYREPKGTDKRTQAVELRARGMTHRTIADRIGVSESQVRRLLSPQWIMKMRTERPQTCGGREASRNIEKYEPREFRRVRQILAPPETILAAARAFAANEIDQNELSRRISNVG